MFQNYINVKKTAMKTLEVKYKYRNLVDVLM